VVEHQRLPQQDLQQQQQQHALIDDQAASSLHNSPALSALPDTDSLMQLEHQFEHSLLDNSKPLATPFNVSLPTEPLSRSQSY